MAALGVILRSLAYVLARQAALTGGDRRTIHAAPDPANDDFIGFLAAAELLGVTNRTIHALIDEGVLQAEITGPAGPEGGGSSASIRRTSPTFSRA